MLPLLYCKGDKSIFTGTLMALEMSGGPDSVLLGSTMGSDRSGSGDLTKQLSHFALKPSLGIKQSLY